MSALTGLFTAVPLPDGGFAIIASPSGARAELPAGFAACLGLTNGSGAGVELPPDPLTGELQRLLRIYLRLPVTSRRALLSFAERLYRPQRTLEDRRTAP